MPSLPGIIPLKYPPPYKLEYIFIMVALQVISLVTYVIFQFLQKL